MKNSVFARAKTMEGIVLVCSCLVVLGCSSESNLGAGGGSSATTSSMGSMTTATRAQISSSTGVDPTCVPSTPTWSPSDECGIFVKLGETGMGTLASPYGNVPAAVAAATTASKPIYIAEGEYEGAVVLPSGTVIFGGLKTDWSFDATVRPTITALPAEIPLKLDAGMAMTQLHHLRVEAKTAELEGGSSVAMVIADAERARCCRLGGRQRKDRREQHDADRRDRTDDA